MPSKLPECKIHTHTHTCPVSCLSFPRRNRGCCLLPASLLLGGEKNSTFLPSSAIPSLDLQPNATLARKMQRLGVLPKQTNRGSLQFKNQSRQCPRVAEWSARDTQSLKRAKNFIIIIDGQAPEGFHLKHLQTIFLSPPGLPAGTTHSLLSSAVPMHFEPYFSVGSHQYDDAEA